MSAIAQGASHQANSLQQLKNAINRSRSGDVIYLSSSQFGTLRISGLSKSIRIVSKNPRNPARFKAIALSNVSNITLQSLKFVGTVRGAYGTGTGLHIKGSNNVSVLNSDFSYYYKGLIGLNSNNLDIINNYFTNNSEDAMAFGDIRNTLIQGNHVNGMKSPNQAHHDLLQIHNPKGNGGSQNVIIRNNRLESKDTSTQGIYMGSNNYGNDAFKNIVIENNKIISGHHHGMTIGNTNGLTIRNNSVVQTPHLRLNKQLNIPKINLQRSSTNVKVINNKAHEISTQAGWTAYGNRIVPLGTQP